MKIKDKKFWAKVQRDFNPYGCWFWQGDEDSDGYGRVARKEHSKRSIRAHRYAFFLYHGRWPEGSCCHSCGNRTCVRPSHLFDDLTRPLSGKTQYEIYNIANDVRKRYAKGSRINGVSALAREFGLSPKFIRSLLK